MRAEQHHGDNEALHSTSARSRRDSFDVLAAAWSTASRPARSTGRVRGNGHHRISWQAVAACKRWYSIETRGLTAEACFLLANQT